METDQSWLCCFMRRIPRILRRNNKKSRRGGTPCGIRPRRLTRQRAPRHGRVAPYLVIRRCLSGPKVYAGSVNNVILSVATTKAKGMHANCLCLAVRPSGTGFGQSKNLAATLDGLALARSHHVKQGLQLSVWTGLAHDRRNDLKRFRSNPS